MLKFIKSLAPNRTSRPRPISDPSLSFSPREWADLPIHHPADPVKRATDLN